jgi:hypothetical protein
MKRVPLPGTTQKAFSNAQTPNALDAAFSPRKTKTCRIKCSRSARDTTISETGR